jgi:BlaI family penicillinase repressor
MKIPRLSRLELQIMDILWSKGLLSIRDIQQFFPASEKRKPAYSTVQTTVYRLEAKRAIRRVRKISNAHIFEAVISRGVAQGRLIDEFFGLFGGRTEPVMAHLIETGKLTLEEIQDAERIVRNLRRKDK